MQLSRRGFARLAGGAALAGSRLGAQGAALTAQEVGDRILKSAGGGGQAHPLDGLKAGEPATAVTGIATTAMATLDVLSRASKDKANLVITLEPTFFGRVDGATADDPVYAAKLDFIRKNRMVVWRFSDLWRAFKPDPFATGLAGAMGWTGYQAGDNVFRYDVPAVTLAALSGDLAKRLNARAGIRVVGDPQTKVRRIALLPGLSTLADAMKNLPDCDLLLAGETREWESVEYAQDTVASGQKKGMIMLGRVLSEEPGMKVCAAWMKGLVPEVPVRWVAAGDPYWRPA